MQIRPNLRWFLFGIAAGALAGWFAARSLSGGEQHPAAPARAPEASAPAHSATAERVRLPDFELLPASLRSRRTSLLAAEVQGRVLRVARRAGERVAEGEVLVELESASFEAAREVALQARKAGEAGLQSASHAVELAQALLEEARAHRERTESLLASGSATAEAAEQARARHAAAQAGLAQSESSVSAARAQLASAGAALDQSEIALARTRIGAPFAGVVSERTVEPGEIATPGRTLLVLVDPAQLRALAIAREELAGSLRPGARLEVEVPAAGVTLAGLVEELVPRVDERSRALELRLALDAPPSCLPGMYARVRLARAERELVLVPAAALSRVGQLATLRVRAADGWRRRYVSVGALQGDGRIEVLAGLSGGETVGWDGE
jgi:RND family efflux transporter MFP subunit